MKKRADQLKRGDVVTDFLGATNVACPAVVVSDYMNGGFMVVCSGNLHAAGRVMVGYAQEVEVESHLTPAQEHADECFALLCYIASSGAARDAWHDDYMALRAKIDPPQAPTYEELALTLQRLRRMGSEAGFDDYEAADDVLDRARRSGKLKL